MLALLTSFFLQEGELLSILKLILSRVVVMRSWVSLIRWKDFLYTGAVYTFLSGVLVRHLSLCCLTWQECRAVPFRARMVSVGKPLQDSEPAEVLQFLVISAAEHKIETEKQTSLE